MSIDWVYALDACASSGVLDYDAAADILGQPPRYVGHPKYNDLPTINTALLPEGTKIKGSPQNDEFNNSSQLVQNPSWKKWLFGGLSLAAIGGTVLAVLCKKGKIKLPDMSKFGSSIKNAGSQVWNFIKKPFVYIANKFKKP